MLNIIVSTIIGFLAVRWISKHFTIFSFDGCSGIIIWYFGAWLFVTLLCSTILRKIFG